MTNTVDAGGVRAAMQIYLDGTREGDLARVQSVFHPQARMSGYLQGQLLVGGPGPFFDAVQNAPAPARSGEPYRAEILRIDVAGPAASVVLDEDTYLGLHFTTFFHLLHIDGRWQIVSKTFMHR